MTPAQATELFELLSEQSGNEKRIAKFGPKYWITTCPNHSHADRHPSCFVSAQHPHGFKCRSCGYSGTLASIAKQNGMAFDFKANIQVKQKQEIKLPDLTTLRLEAWSETYRGLDAEQWGRFGALKWYDTFVDDQGEERLSAIRLLLPIYQNGLLVSYTGRRIDDSAFMKYNSYAGCPTSQLLYPYDFTKPTWPIVLVEGPLDAIKYWLYGIPALAVLGCQNWSDYKLKLILSRNPSTVWLSFDNDANKDVNHGQKAQREIYNQLKRYVDVQTMSLPPGNDPFDLVPELLQEIYNAVWSRHAEKTNPQPQQVANG